MLAFLAVFGAMVILAVLIVVGDIAAVTQWIPHAGHHGHAPSTFGYIALYALAVLLNGYAWGYVIGCAAAAWEDS